MTEYAGATARFTQQNIARESIRAIVKVTIGGTGAVSATSAPDPAFTVTRSTTGTYTLTYPKCVACTILHGLYSPAGTVVTAYTTAKSATAGTATIVTSTVVGATDPASGDVLTLVFEMETR